MSYPSDANYYNRSPDEYPQATFVREASNLQVVSLSLIATGTYNDQMSRPYATQYDVNNQNDIQETLHRSYHAYQQQLSSGQLGGATAFTITPELIAGATSSFIMPSATPECAIQITNGWGNQRARFVLRVIAHRVGVGPQEFVIMGYTDQYGVSTSGHVDPRMEFTINAIFELQKQTVLTGYGTQQKTILVNASQLLANEKWSGDIMHNAQYRMRPEDVMSEISLSHIPDLQNGRVDVVDARSRGTSTPVKSAFANANPTNYLAAILGGITTGQYQAQLQNRFGDVYDLATTAVADGKVARDPFLRAMGSIRSSSVSHKFTFEELCQLDPNTADDKITTVYQRSAAQLVGAANRPGENLHMAGTTTPWHGTDMLTHSAAKLANALPHLMVENMIQNCAIHATNRFGPVPVLLLSNVSGIVENVDMTPYAEVLKSQFVTYLLNDITQNGAVGYQIDITASIVGEIWISMSVDGFPASDFVAPAFANSLTSPVTTRNSGNIKNLASNFNELQRTVFPSATESPPATNMLWTPSGRSY